MRDRDPVWTRWDEIDRIFDRLLEHPAPQRERELRGLCQDDEDLYRAVLDLLRLSETEGTRGTAPGADLVRVAYQAEPGPDSLEPGDAVGGYEILGVLGAGGMATVYEAERRDGVYRRTVALKVLRRGLDTDRIVGRFIAERQILSDFAHPNIARLLDGGATADGRPFLVMEKVNGEPLTAWADRRRLGVDGRLEIVLQAAGAVQEAHRRLVVHRDLKPSNILVDGEGQVKLLDFGIAKLVDPESEDPDLTRLGPYPLTRSYASPEQIKGEPVTVSSDVYQLGLILFELLTGLRPLADEGNADLDPDTAPSPRAAFSAAAPDRRAEIASARSTTAGALDRRLRGDLDTIVRKALQPTALDRYRSVEDLAQDIRLHLEGRPIRARPAPRSLRVRKWLGRNRWAPPVAALLTLGVAGYLATLTLTARRLEVERNEARAQAERAERIRGFLIDLFDPFVVSAQTGDEVPTVEGRLVAAARHLRTDLSHDPAIRADLLTAVAAILARLDRTDEGQPLVEEALAIRADLGMMGTPAAAGDLSVLANIIDYEDPDSAIALLRRAVTVLRATTPPRDPRLADALAELAWALKNREGGSDPALAEEAFEIYENATGDYRREAATVLSTIAEVHAASGDLEAAEDAAREAYERQREAMGPDHAATVVAGVRLAGVLDQSGRFDESVPLYLQGLRVLESTVGADHAQTLSIRNNLATTLNRAGRNAEAVVIHREILEIHRRKAGGDVDLNVATSLQNLATALKDEGRLQEADSLADRAHRIFLEVLPAGHYLQGIPLLTRAEVLLALGRPNDAEEAARRALAVLAEALPAGHYAVGVARCRLGAALVAQDRTDESGGHVEDGLAIILGDERAPEAYVAECEGLARSLGLGRPR